MANFFEVKKAQISFFVIIAILLIAGISILFITKPFSKVSSKLQPVEAHLLDCISNLAEEGVVILGEQGGYIKPPEFEQGSEYMPFGSQINYFGSILPHWFYISGNNIKKTQTPSIKDMESQISEYVSENIDECSFDDFADYSVMSEDKTEIKTRIFDKKISLEVYRPITISYKDGTSKKITKHSSVTSSNLGYLYKKATEVYNAEQEKMFLEQYAIDTLSLNAPTTGAEVTCSPRTWNSDEIKTRVKDALRDNIRTIKLKGNYYSLGEKEKKYFVHDLGKDIDEQVIFFYSPEFPTRFEIEPEENGLMSAMPVGIQEGFEMLGFCYVPYHFVYSIAFPVVIQIIDDSGTLFQFSTIVVIDKNKPKEAEINETFDEFESALCEDERKIETLAVTTHDPSNNPVRSEISFKCLSTQCSIGSTEIKGYEAVLEEKIPQCINGLIIASAEGYSTTKQEVSTNNPVVIDLTLYPLYKLDINLGIEELKENEKVFLSFTTDDYTTSAVYPEQKTVKLKDGIYDIKARLFREGGIKLGKETTEKCIKVPETGIKGILGMKREECYDIEIPEQTLTEVLAGGGKTKLELSDYELSASKEISINIPEFKVPENVEDMQSIYVLSETSELYVLLR